MPQDNEVDTGCTMACGRTYDPVCATDGKSTKVFTNLCEMSRASCVEKKGEWNDMEFRKKSSKLLFQMLNQAFEWWHFEIFQFTIQFNILNITIKLLHLTLYCINNKKFHNVPFAEYRQTDECECEDFAEYVS